MRLLLVGQVAQTYGVLPRVAERDLESDPEQLSLLCIPVMRYAEAFHAYRSANKARIAQWGSDPLMAEVTEREFVRAGGELGVAVVPDGSGAECEP